MVLGEVLSVFFVFSLVAFGLLYYLLVGFGLCPFGNKFLIIQKKKKGDDLPTTNSHSNVPISKFPQITKHLQRRTNMVFFFL